MTCIVPSYVENFNISIVLSYRRHRFPQPILVSLVEQQLLTIPEFQWGSFLLDIQFSMQCLMVETIYHTASRSLFVVLSLSFFDFAIGLSVFIRITPLVSSNSSLWLSYLDPLVILIPIYFCLCIRLTWKVFFRIASWALNQISTFLHDNKIHKTTTGQDVKHATFDLFQIYSRCSIVEFAHLMT